MQIHSILFFLDSIYSNTTPYVITDVAVEINSYQHQENTTYCTRVIRDTDYGGQATFWICGKALFFHQELLD